MSKESYFEYCKAREANFIAKRNAFIEWLHVPPNKKSLLNLLSFIAWDRVGIIVEIALAFRKRHHKFVNFFISFCFLFFVCFVEI